MALYLTFPKQFYVNSAGQPYPAAKMHTYRAGTTTNLATYTTAALGTPHANPVVADSNGIFPAIYVDPNSGYDLKVVLKDQADVTLYTEDNIPATPWNRAQIGQLLYPRTPAEIAAGVTPTYYYYEPTDPRRFAFDAANTGAQNKTALESALAAIAPPSSTAGSGGGTLYFQAGLFLLDPGIIVPDWVCLIGAANRGTVFKKTSASTLLTLGDFVVMENIRIDQNSYANPAVYMPAASQFQRMTNCETANSPGPSIGFDVAGGSGFSAVSCDFTTSASIMAGAAVEVTSGSYTPGGLAYPHHFLACHGAGSTLIDMAGMNNLDLVACRSEGLMCSSGAGNLHVVGCRVGSTGSTLVWEGIDSGQFIGNSIGQDIELSNCDAIWWFSECPAQEVVETGTSAGNHLYLSNLDWAPTWTAASSNPAIGNGTIAASYSREGRKITASIQITMGSTTTYGTGRWRISKPLTTDTRVCIGSAFITDADTGIRYHAMVLNEATTYWTLFISGGTTSVDATTPITWAAGDTLWMTVDGWLP